MKYLKIRIDLTNWHLIPYSLAERKVVEIKVKEWGFLCFKLIAIYK